MTYTHSTLPEQGDGGTGGGATSLALGRCLIDPNGMTPEVEQNSPSSQQRCSNQRVVRARQRHENLASFTRKGYASKIGCLCHACSVGELDFNAAHARQLDEVAMTPGEAQVAREARIEDGVDTAFTGAMQRDGNDRLALLADASSDHRRQRSSIAAR